MRELGCAGVVVGKCACDVATRVLPHPLPARTVAAVTTVSRFNSMYSTKFYVDDLSIPPLRFALLKAMVRAFDLLIYPFWGWFLDSHYVS